MGRDQRGVYRILDANFNRAKEGLRVCEDVCRFVLDEKELTESYKKLRHQLTREVIALKMHQCVQARDINGDVGRFSIKEEFQRRDIQDIFYANSQRIKESVRVLEEFFKLKERSLAQKLKVLRYKLYDLEKKAVAMF